MSSDLTQTVLTEAQRLFDAAGITTAADGNWIILGLLTTPERDLDIFLRHNDGTVDFLSGFEKHAGPSLNEFIDFLRVHGIAAEIYGPLGYPRGNDCNLKQQAVAAGLGNWGRSSLLLHPEFGPNLRLMSIRTYGTKLSPTGTDEVTYRLSPFCESCRICIEMCPLSIIGDGELIDPAVCLSNSYNMLGDWQLQWCSVCIENCPAGKAASR